MNRLRELVRLYRIFRQVNTRWDALRYAWAVARD